MDVPPKEPNFFHRLLLFISNVVPREALGPVAGSLGLVARRIVLRDVNLYAAPLDDTSNGGTTDVPSFRTPTGKGNDACHFEAGASSTAFGRNMPPAAFFDPNEGPPVQLVASRLLQRTRFRPAGDQLNVLAAAWIQAMAHDWFGHVDSEETIELEKSTPTCPMKSFRFKSTAKRSDNAFDNFRSHWWDGSFVYGQNDEQVARAREGKGGRLVVGDIPGALPRDEEGCVLVGDPKNGWLGVALLQDIFLREHNAIADAICNKHLEWADDDEKVFNFARMAVAAIVAKIHTVDWTIELLKTNTLDVGM